MLTISIQLIFWICCRVCVFPGPLNRVGMLKWQQLHLRGKTVGVYHVLGQDLNSAQYATNLNHLTKVQYTIPDTADVKTDQSAAAGWSSGERVFGLATATPSIGSCFIGQIVCGDLECHHNLTHWLTNHRTAQASACQLINNLRSSGSQPVETN